MSDHALKEHISGASYENGYQDAQFVTAGIQISSIIDQLTEIADDPNTEDPVRTFAEAAIQSLDDAHQSTMTGHEWLA